MRPRWPKDTDFQRLVLDVESEQCELCGRVLHVCGHRFHRIHTLQGPVELVCRLAHCSDLSCPARHETLSPAAEFSLTSPWWLIGWDVFAWMGQRRFSRHWDVPQLRAELRETYHIDLSKDTVVNYLHRYQNLLAARQQDPLQLAQAYQGLNSLVLSIDGLQPEKGHETLYVVRELNAKRVWFAETLLSSSTAEVRPLFVRAREWAERLALPVKLWLSDKQDAFLKGIAAEFPDVPHRYCQNHFLRNLAKPTLAKDSTAKVQMRQKVRGLREIERDVLEQRREREASQQQDATQTESEKDVASTALPAGASAARPEQEAEEGTAPTDPAVQDGANQGAAASAAEPAVAPPEPSSPAGQAAGGKDTAEQVVLDYCAAVRGILNDDQGGPLHPPGVRMAEGLSQVQESLQKNLELNKPGPAHEQLARLAGCIASGLASVKEEQEEVRQEVAEIAKVAATLDEAKGSRKERKRQYEKLQKEHAGKGGEFHDHVGRLMADWEPGLFLGPRAKKGQKGLQDNLELERWFRKPKRHERKIHGRRHAGVRIVQEGPTLVLVLDAHDAHPEPFTAEELLPYWPAEEPPEQQQAMQRRKIMRRARSKKLRPSLLTELESRYGAAV
jgi:peptidoglycan hydrolase CwlO-like protein